jgi:hypothetical protein
MVSQRFEAISSTVERICTRRHVMRVGAGASVLAALGLGGSLPPAGAFKSLSGCEKHCQRYSGSCQHDCQQCCKKVVKGNQHRCDFGCGYINQKKR